MRCKKLLAVLLAAVFLLGTIVPAVAGDGRHLRIIEEKMKDHPWQDDSANGPYKPSKTSIGMVIGPITFTVRITIPFSQRPSQTTASANKPVTSTKVEEGK
jgi:hypothetical protein